MDWVWEEAIEFVAARFYFGDPAPGWTRLWLPRTDDASG